MQKGTPAGRIWKGRTGGIILKPQWRPPLHRERCTHVTFWRTQSQTSTDSQPLLLRAIISARPHTRIASQQNDFKNTIETIIDNYDPPHSKIHRDDKEDGMNWTHAEIEMQQRRETQKIRRSSRIRHKGEETQDGEARHRQSQEHRLNARINRIIIIIIIVRENPI